MLKGIAMRKGIVGGEPPDGATGGTGTGTGTGCGGGAGGDGGDGCGGAEASWPGAVVAVASLRAFSGSGVNSPT